MLRVFVPTAGAMVALLTVWALTALLYAPMFTAGL